MRAKNDKFSSIAGQPERRYWVVSPNVKPLDNTVTEWSEASIREHAAFMGWRPDDRDGKKMVGHKFAGLTDRGIEVGHVVLIARRSDNKPEIVGFGIVHGKYVRTLKGFKPPNNKPFGSMRRLSRFKKCFHPPPGIPLMDALPLNRSLTELHPDRDLDHKKVCRWMDNQLGLGRDPEPRPMVKPQIKTQIVPPPKSPPVGEYRTKSELRKARNIEAKLLREYDDWLKNKDRHLSALKYGSLCCDRYEEATKNLIEAKSSLRREHIRMAVGQLLDYAYQGRKDVRKPNMAILVPKKPDPDIEQWLQHLKISIIWRASGSFSDNAKGQFTSQDSCL